MKNVLGPNIESLWCVFKVWLLFMMAFSLGRIFYLFDYFFILTQDPFSWGEILFALLSACRFDSSVSAMVVSPLFLGACTSGELMMTRAGVLGWKIYAITAVFFCWLAIIGDHYFYVYFKDHFNVFFWESFENWSNFKLAVGGFGDEVPLPLAVALVVLGTFIWSLVLWQANKVWPHPRFIMKWSDSSPKIVTVLVLIVFLIAARGTVHYVPLLKQDTRQAIASNRIINLLHTNPFFPLYRGMRDYRQLQQGRKHNHVRPVLNSEQFALASLFVPGARTAGEGQNLHFEQDVRPRPVLVRKPKHIVLFFMESFSEWPASFDEDDFGAFIMPNFRQMLREGWYFPHHFSPGAGTVKNIMAAIYSVPTPREFFPSLNYHPWAYKRFPQLIHKVMKEEGYASRFYYGGFGAWHRLYSFMPAIGFDNFFAESAFPDLPHNRSGLFDASLFAGLDRNLSREEGPTFNFVMSLSNHPPYIVPEEFNRRDWHIPASLKKRLVAGPEQFYDRFNAFRYSDAALGDFFEKARRSPYFFETLFVITGDHGFGGTLAFNQAWGWKEEVIPLLFFAPGLLAPEYAGITNPTTSTHLDLMPTLLSMVVDKPRTVITWGKNLADTPVEPYQVINKYFTCLRQTCLKNNQMFRVGEDRFFVGMKEDPKKKDEFHQREWAYYQSALQFLINFNDNNTADNPNANQSY